MKFRFTKRYRPLLLNFWPIKSFWAMSFTNQPINQSNFMVRDETDTHARYRSLLQKAVRRGNDALVIATCALLESLGSREKSWVRERAAVITFEECWPLGGALVFNKRFHSKVAALVRAARSTKAKGACGLGLLAHRLAEGGRSVLDGSEQDRHLRIVAEAVERPEDFWNWVKTETKTEQANTLIERAYRFRNAGLPQDRAITRAGAYLALQGELPKLAPAGGKEKSFPYWVALDVHTPEGRRVLRDIARDLHVRLPQLEWVSFFFEGSVANRAIPSFWWDRYCRWRFEKEALPMQEAHLLWDPVRPQVIEALSEDSRHLHREIYQWKMEHLDRIGYLRQQVDLFLEHFEKMTPDQMEMFGEEDDKSD